MKISGPKTFLWYGGKSETDSQAVKLTDDVVNTATTTEGTFTFIQTAGNWVDYNDFTQFNLFDPNTNTVIATAQLEAGAPSTGGTDPKTATVTTVSSGKATPTGTSKTLTATSVPNASTKYSVGKLAAAVVSIAMSFLL